MGKWAECWFNLQHHKTSLSEHTFHRFEVPANLTVDASPGCLDFPTRHHYGTLFLSVSLLSKLFVPGRKGTPLMDWRDAWGRTCVVKRIHWIVFTRTSSEGERERKKDCRNLVIMYVYKLQFDYIWLCADVYLVSQNLFHFLCLCVCLLLSVCVLRRGSGIHQPYMMYAPPRPVCSRCKCFRTLRCCKSYTNNLFSLPFARGKGGFTSYSVGTLPHRRHHRIHQNWDS